MSDSLNPEDVVPAFRSDLKLADPVQGAGEKLVTVADPVSGKSMAFRGFELSIARMLNGQRTAGEVIDAASQIGLPISLEGLSGFVKKLRSLDFLSHPLDAPVGEPTTWGERREWPDEVRARYQVALREARSNDLLSAKQHLDELLRDAPELKEARDLQVWVDERLRAPAAGKRLPTFTDVFGVVERTWFEEGERQSEANAAESKRLASLSDIPAAVAPAAEAPVSEAVEAPKKKGGGVGKIIAVLLVLVVAGAGAAAALYPIPYLAKGTFELQSRSALNVEVAREGVVGAVAVKEGDWVEAGARLFDYDNEAARKRLADAEKKVVELQKKSEKSGAGKKLGDAKKKLEKAQGDLKDAQGDLEKAKTKGKKPAIAKAEKKVKKLEGAVAKAQKAVDGAGSGVEKGSELEKAIAEREALRPQVEAAPFNAPVAGFVSALKVKQGDPVKTGSVVCHLDDSKVLSVKMAMAKGEKMAEGQTASLSVEGKKVDVKIEKIINGEGKGTLDNSKGGFKAGQKGDLTIDTGGRTLLSKYL
ncbi:MAG: biotin/lipoyl-binding protein [Archangiaceae bacterium]|nr:biotin/lipoyl-binding protein [Archangiaceae bacterium]